MDREQYTRITVPLSRDEFIALRAKAEVAYRHPRDQARFILRNALLGCEQSDTKSSPQVGLTALERQPAQ